MIAYHLQVVDTSERDRALAELDREREARCMQSLTPSLTGLLILLRQLKRSIENTVLLCGGLHVFAHIPVGIYSIE